METDPYVDLVDRARRGDVDAFGGLVERFQDMAVSSAWGELGDLADAVDATQEAFIDALRKIDLLRDPAAFPAWLQRIVTTHCRRIRRHREVPTPLEPDRPAEATTEATVAGRQEAERVRRSVGRLPPHERVVVAMHYLGGCTYPEIAGLLGISEGTARKRAHTARSRLLDDLEGTEMEDVREAFGRIRPSRDGRFAGATLLFAAIAREDVDLARRVLESDPGLVDAQEEWDEATAGEAGLLPAREATPLVRAVGRGNRELVELLLRHGADVDRACGCAGGESPLWTATVSGDEELVRLLLVSGADPNRSAFGGVTPLHVATMRGHGTIARRLVEAGARSDVADERGRTPLDWARLKGVGFPRADDARAAAVHGGSASWLESGMRAVNLFAPLPRGGLVRWEGPPGTGSIVVLVELAHNLARFEGLDTTIVGSEHHGLTEAELRHAFAELDPVCHAHVDLAGADLPSDARRRVFADAVTGVYGAAAGHRRQLIVVVAHPGHIVDIETELPRLMESGELVVLLDFTGDATADTVIPPDATITMSERLARAGLYPAIDPDRSSGRYPDPDHARLVDEARSLMARYRRLDPELTLQAAPEDGWVEDAQELHRFLTQPFQTTEPFTGEPGVAASIAETVASVDGLLRDERTSARRSAAQRD